LETIQPIDRGLGPLAQLNRYIQQATAPKERGKGDSALSGIAVRIDNGRNSEKRERARELSLIQLIRGAASHRIRGELQAIDSKVKAHELAHMAALGSAAASGIHYTYSRGPDGRMYATGGSIKVDLDPVPGNPEATIRKARQVRRAALAPGDPSAADMKMAARAYRVEQDAKQELEQEESGAEGIFVYA
jgi:hypothetical protein